MRALCLLALTFTLGACRPTADVLGGAQSTPGQATPEQPTMPAGHPEIPGADPIASGDPVGRAPRRLTVDQLRAAFGAATAQRWMGKRGIDNPMMAYGRLETWQQSGTRSVDMLLALQGTLGRPDFRTSTVENVEPGVVFGKLAEDAARDVCRSAVSMHTGAFQTLPDMAWSDAARPMIDQTLTQLALLLWGRSDLTGSEVSRLEDLYRNASSAMQTTDGGMPVTAGTADGWRAICIAMTTDPQFLTY